jgi:Uma2 family endonuclease
MGDAKNELVQQWLRKASHDLTAARTLTRREPVVLDTATYHCQQPRGSDVMVIANKTPTKTIDGEQRFVLRRVGWKGYQSLMEMIDDQPIRLIYDRGDVELMSPLPKHERKKSLLGQFVRILAREFCIPVMPTGSTTWNREDLDKGLEADESFYLGDLGRVGDPDNVDLEFDPPPDLAIEIELTRSALDRIGIYGALRVPELWRFDGRTLRVLLLQPEGSYKESTTSAAFPSVPMDEIAKFGTREGVRDENALLDEFLGWVRENLLPNTEENDR